MLYSLLCYRNHNVVFAKIHQTTTNKQHRTTLIQHSSKWWTTLRFLIFNVRPKMYTATKTAMQTGDIYISVNAVQVPHVPFSHNDFGLVHAHASVTKHQAVLFGTSRTLWCSLFPTVELWKWPLYQGNCMAGTKQLQSTSMFMINVVGREQFHPHVNDSRQVVHTLMKCLMSPSSIIYCWSIGGNVLQLVVEGVCVWGGV